MSPDTGRAFILVVSKRETLASAIREHVSEATADLQSVGGPEEARRYAQRHTPSLVVVDGESSQGMWIVDRIREEPALSGVTLMVLSAEKASTRMVEHWFSDRPADIYARLPLSSTFFSSHIRPLLVPAPASGSVPATGSKSDDDAASQSPAQTKKIEAAKRGIEKALKAAKTFNAERDRAVERLKIPTRDLHGRKRRATTSTTRHMSVCDNARRMFHQHTSRGDPGIEARALA